MTETFHRNVSRMGYSWGIDRKLTWSRLCCDCIVPCPASASRLPVTDEEWEDFLKMAQTQKIQGLCYTFLSRQQKSVPTQVISSLAKSSHATGFRNIQICAELSDLVKPIREAGIEVILLKGVALLTCQIYSDPTQRVMGDIDILVKKQDLPMVEAIVRNLGYVSFNNSDLSLEWNRRHFLELNYVKPDLAGHMVDIHWRIDLFFDIPCRDLFQRSRKLSMNGVSISVLSPEDMLLHLCLHTVFHHCLIVDLRPWADLARIVQLAPDWSKVMDCAQKYRVERVLYTVLFLGHKFAGAQIPTEVLARLRQACPRPLVRLLERQKELLQSQNPFLKTWFCIRFIREWRNKICYLMSILFRLRSILFRTREELCLLYDFVPDSWWAYLKYLLIHQRYILGKALIKRIANFRKRYINPVYS